MNTHVVLIGTGLVAGRSFIGDPSPEKQSTDADAVRVACAPRSVIVLPSGTVQQDKHDASNLMLRALRTAEALLVVGGADSAPLLVELRYILGAAPVPIIALGFGQEREQAQALTAGADATLAWPLDARLIDALIRRLHARFDQARDIAQASNAVFEHSGERGSKTDASG